MSMHCCNFVRPSTRQPLAVLKLSVAECTEHANGRMDPTVLFASGPTRTSPQTLAGALAAAAIIRAALLGAKRSLSGFKWRIAKIAASSSAACKSAAQPTSKHIDPLLLFRFGVIADVQYANRDDAPNYIGSRIRRYRRSRQLWNEAVQWWHHEDANFIVQLGDFIDGSNRAVPGAGLKALGELLSKVDWSASCTPHWQPRTLQFHTPRSGTWT